MKKKECNHYYLPAKDPKTGEAYRKCKHCGHVVKDALA